MKKEIYEIETVSTLKSFGDVVAKYFHEENHFEIYLCNSSDTALHINQFLEFYGFDPLSEDEIKAEINKED